MEQLMKQLIERIEALERRCFNLAWGKKSVTADMLSAAKEYQGL